MKFFTTKTKKKKSIDDIARGGGAAKADPFMTVLTTVPVKKEEPVKKQANYVNLSDRDLERAEKRAEKKARAAAKKKKVAKKSQSKEAPMKKKKTTPSTKSKRKLKKNTSSITRRSSSLTRPTPIKEEEAQEEVKTEETKKEVKTDAKMEKVPFPESSVMPIASANDRKGRSGGKSPSKGKSQRSKPVTSEKKKTVSIDASAAPAPSANVNNLASPAQSVNTLKVDNRQRAKERTPKKADEADHALAELDTFDSARKDVSAVDDNVDVVVDDAPQPQGVLSWFQSTVMNAFPEEEFKTIGWMESVDYTVDDSVTTGNTGDDDRTIETYSTYGSASYVTAASAATDGSHTTGDSYTTASLNTHTTASTDESGTVGSRTTGSHSQYSTDYTEDTLELIDRINEDEEHDDESAPPGPSSMLSKFNIFKKNKRSASPELKLSSAARSRSSSIDVPNQENSNSSKESAPEEESANASKDEESAKKSRSIGSRRARASTPASVASTRSKSSKIERFIARANSSSPAGNVSKKAIGTRTVKTSPAASTGVRQTKRSLSPAIFDKVLAKTRASTPVSMSDADSLPANVPKKASGTSTVKTSSSTSTGARQTKRSLSPAIFDKVLSKTRASTPAPRIVPHAGTCSLDGVINEAEDMIATAELDGVMDEAEEMIAKADFLPSKYSKPTVVDDGTNNISVELSIAASVSIDETREDNALEFPVVEEETPAREDASNLFSLISVGTDELMAQAQELLMASSA